MLPSKLYRKLMENIQIALDEPDSYNGRSLESIEKFRQAFFDIIIDLFLNYQKRVSKVNGESIFDYKGFLEESDSEYKEFFYRYL